MPAPILGKRPPDTSAVTGAARTPADVVPPRSNRRASVHYLWPAGVTWTGLIVVAMLVTHQGELAMVGLGEFAVFIALWGAGVLALAAGLLAARGRERERQRIVAALADSEARYRQLFNDSPKVMLIQDLATQRILLANAAAQRLYGYTGAEFAALGLSDLEANGAGRVRPESVGGARHRRKDGAELDVEVVAQPVQWDGRQSQCIVVTELSERQQLAAAVRVQAESYHALLNTFLDAVVETDEAERILDANPVLEKLTGYSRDELLAMTVRELDAQEDAAIVAEHREQLRRDGSARFETKLRTKAGRIIDVEVSVARITDGTRFISFVRDVTERNAATEALRQSESALKAAQRVAGVGSWKWHVQSDRLEWSEEMYRIFGVAREGFTGRLQDVIATSIHPEDRAKVQAANRGVIERSRPKPEEYRIIWPDGTVRYVRAEGGELVCDTEGRPQLLTGIVQDLTNRVQAQAALRASEAQLVRAMQLARLGSWEFDAATQTLTFNDQLFELYATTAEREGGYQMSPERYANEFIPPEDRPVIAAEVGKVLSSTGAEAEWMLEHRIIRRDGQIRHFLVRIRLVTDASGRVVGSRGANQDITERKEAEIALRTVNSRFSTLIASMRMGVLVEDTERRVALANAAFCELFGATVAPAQLIGTPVAEFVRRSGRLFSDPAGYVMRIGELVQRRESVHGEELHLADGRVFERDYLPISADGTGLEHLWIVRDVSEQKRLQDALSRRLVALTSPIDVADRIGLDELFNLPDLQKLQDRFARATGVASIITKPDGTPITEPSNFTRFCAGVVRKTEKGRCLCFKSDAVIGRCNPDGPVVQRCLSAGLWDAGASIVVGGRHVANWLIGQVRDENQDEAHLREFAQEIGADEGELIAAFRQVPSMSRTRFEEISQMLFTLAQQLSSVAYQNVQQARFITERDRAEQALRISEERFREAIEHAGAGYFRLDREGRYESVNRAWLQMHGLTAPEQIVGKEFTSVQIEEDLAEARRIVEEGFAGGEIASGEFSRRVADGSVGYHTFSLHPVRRGGEVVALEGFLIDTTSLRRARADYQMLFETMLDGFAVHQIICDDAGKPVDYRFVAVNPAFERLTGLKEADVVGRTVLEVMPLTERVWIETYGRVALTGEPVTFENHAQVLNRYFKVSAFQPAPGLFACIFVDMTARKLAEIELRKLSRVVEQSPVSVIITDPRGSIEYINPYFTATSGYTLEDVRGRTPALLGSGETPADTYHALWQTITAGQEWRGEFHNRKKDGTLFWEAVTIGPITDESGRITHYVAVKEDITDRKRAEERIREQAALLDETQDAIVVTTLDRIVRYWNRAAERMYGISAADASGRAVEELVGVEDTDDLAVKWSQLLQQHEWSGERQQSTRNGSVIDVRIRATVVRDPAERPTAVLLVITDVTEGKRLEKQFLRAQRLESLGALASGVAHDLNNVLTPILMSVELLRPLAQAQHDRDMLQLLSDSARRGSDIVQQLLLFGRGSDSPRSVINAGDIVKDMGRMMRETFPKNIVLTVQAPADLWLIEADRTQIHQVVLNLCVNARDAMPQGGRLAVLAENVQLDETLAAAVGAKHAGAHVRIQVRDTGSGIAAEHLERIFDPFFTTKPVGQGTGLGLATVLGIVRSHGGAVSVKSQLGQGSTFEIHLPAAIATPAGSNDADGAGNIRGRGELILVVEDEEGIRSLLQRALSSHNYLVMIASDGAEALGVFAQNADRVKLVMTDAMMPVMDGAQTVKALRRLRPNLPVIAISGLPAQRAELEKNPGPQIRFLPKPFTTDHALRLVREALDEADASPANAT